MPVLGQAWVTLGTKDDDLKRGLRKAKSDVNDFVRGIASISVIGGLGYAIGTELKAGISSATMEAVKYNSSIEDSNIGIAALLSSQGKFVNSLGAEAAGIEKVNAALSMSSDIIQQLQIDNLKTTATFNQLFSAFQEGLGPGLAIKMTVDQVRELSLAATQAAAAIRLPMDQLGQEMRALMSGDIDRNARIAKVLGITPEDWRRYQGDAQGYFDFLMKKLSAFRDFGDVTAGTYSGLMSNFGDAVSKLLGTGTAPFFSELKSSLKEWYDSIVMIDQRTGEIRLDPGFKEDIRILNELLSGALDTVKFLGSGVKGLTIEPLKLFIVPHITMPTGDIPATSDAIGKEMKRLVSEAQDALDQYQATAKFDLTLIGVANAIGSPFEALATFRQGQAAQANLNTIIDNLIMLQDKMVAAGMDADALNGAIAQLKAGNVEAAKAIIKSAYDLDSFKYAANDAALSTDELKKKLQELSGISLEHLGRELEDSVTKSMAKIQALQSGVSLDMLPIVTKKAERLHELDLKEYWGRYLGASPEDMAKMAEERAKIEGAAYWETYAHGMEQSARKALKASKQKTLGLFDVDSQVLRAQKQIMDSFQVITNASYDMRVAMAEHSGNYYSAEAMRQRQWAEQEKADFKERVASEEQAYQELWEKLSTHKGGVTPEAWAHLEDLRKSVEALKAELPGYNALIDESAKKQLQWADESRKLQGAIDLAQANLDYAELTGNMQGQLQAQLALIEATKAQKLANVDLDIPGLADAYKKLYDEQARVASIMGGGDFFAGFMHGLSDTTGGIQTLGQLGNDVAKELKTGFGDVFKGLITGADDIEDRFANMLDKLSEKFMDFAMNMAFNSMFGGGMGGGGGGGFGLFLNSLFGGWSGTGGLALGGPTMAGRPILVGEQGPELFIPPSSGRIIPNDEVRRSKDSSIQIPTPEVRIYSNDPGTRVEFRWRESRGNQAAQASRMLTHGRRNQ